MDLNKREQFLLQLHSEMWANINRHINVSWQAVSVLAGAFAILFAFNEKQSPTIDFATGLMIVIAMWSLGHIYDANTWFNRNLGIIANIERQFLTSRDEKEIHFYFVEKHRAAGKLLQHFAVHRDIALAVIFVVLSAHFYMRVLPGIHLPFSNFETSRAVPYLLAFIGFCWVLFQRNRQTGTQKEFNDRSPGAPLSPS